MRRNLGAAMLLVTWSLLALGGCSPAGSSVAPAGTPATASPLGSVASPSASPTVTTSPIESGGCVNPPPSLAAIVALDPAARLRCFGSSSLTFQATASKAIFDCGIGPPVEPAWFCLPGVFLVVPDASPDNAPPALDVYWNPASGLTPASFPDGKTLGITGHFDDPAAQGCHVATPQPGQSAEPSDAAVLTCRETFIVTAVH